MRNSLVLLLLVILVAGCSKKVYYKYNIRYQTDVLGVGPGETSEFLSLKSGTENSLVSRAILETFQDMHMAVIRESGDSLLAQRKKYATDTLTFDQSDIREYNSKVQAKFKLPTDGRIFKITYKISYFINGTNLQVEMRLSSILLQQGSGSSTPGSYKKDYDGSYFSDLVKKKINEKMKQLAH